MFLARLVWGIYIAMRNQMRTLYEREKKTCDDDHNARAFWRFIFLSELGRIVAGIYWSGFCMVDLCLLFVCMEICVFVLVVTPILVFHLVV